MAIFLKTEHPDGVIAMVARANADLAQDGRGLGRKHHGRNSWVRAGQALDEARQWCRQMRRGSPVSERQRISQFTPGSGAMVKRRRRGSPEQRRMTGAARCGSRNAASA